MNMSVGVLDHYNVSTRKLARPSSSMRTCWDSRTARARRSISPARGSTPASHPVLHLNDIAGTDRQQRPDSGVIDHVAFGSRGFEAMKQHLTGKGMPHRVNQVPN